jgi:hypothetical protein
MRFKLLAFLMFIYVVQTCAQARYTQIKDYKVYFGWAHHAPQDWMVIRKFTDRNKSYYLLVNPQTLETKIDDSSFYQVKPMSADEAKTFFKSTPYQKALRKAENSSVMIQDAGIERGLPKEAGISLTADLCPSHKPLDRRIFTDIFNEFKR